jgi:hypothetical protein
MKKKYVSRKEKKDGGGNGVPRAPVVYRKKKLCYHNPEKRTYPFEEIFYLICSNISSCLNDSSWQQSQ